MTDREELLAKRKLRVAECATRAEQIWSKMDKNQKTGVRFGMFPAEVMREAEKDGFTSHELSVALMDCASRNGGMRA